MAEKERDDKQIDIEEIMQEIREKVLAKRAALSVDERPSVRLEGKRFPPEFYEHLYHASLAYDQIDVKMQVSRSSIPVVGPLLQWGRGKIHELVLFYVNQVAAQQIAVNMHLLQALSILGEELEKMPEPEAREDGG